MLRKLSGKSTAKLPWDNRVATTSAPECSCDPITSNLYSAEQKIRFQTQPQSLLGVATPLLLPN